jgi:hypothetical protein
LRKLLVVVSVFCMPVLLASFTERPVTSSFSPIHTAFLNHFSGNDNTATALYTELALADAGLSAEAFEAAYKGYNKLVRQHKLGENAYLTICDFSQSSRNKRLYLVDLNKKEIVMNTYVAHGRNSGHEFATKFSNKPESLQSSLGFYITKHTYHGEHGLSLKVAGLEPGFNDKAFDRAIVIHGADYIGAARLRNSSFMGRSYGCPAVPAAESAALINTIKNGSCLFIYHPAKNYLLGSKILND